MIKQQQYIFDQSNPCILNRKNDRNSKKRKKFYAITTKAQSETWTIIIKTGEIASVKLVQIAKKREKKKQDGEKINKVKISG